VDFGTFKALQGLLFVGAAFAFGLWQLAALRRSRRRAEDKEPRPASPAKDHSTDRR
jgi:hypothetical protein